MKKTITYTHRGWFGVCPVHVGGLGTSAPDIDPRHFLLEPLFWVSEFVFSLCFIAEDLLGLPSHGWPVRMTGKLAEPIVYEVEV